MHSWSPASSGPLPFVNVHIGYSRRPILLKAAHFSSKRNFDMQSVLYDSETEVLDYVFKNRFYLFYVLFSIEATQEKNLKESISKVTEQEQKTTDAAKTFRQTKKFKDAVHYGECNFAFAFFFSLPMSPLSLKTLRSK